MLYRFKSCLMFIIDCITDVAVDVAEIVVDVIVGDD